MQMVSSPIRFHPQAVDLGPERGLSDFETGGIAGYFEDFKKSENEVPGQKMPFGVCFHPQAVDLGPERGLSDFETGGIAGYFEDFKKSENEVPGQKMPFVDEN